MLIVMLFVVSMLCPSFLHSKNVIPVYLLNLLRNFEFQHQFYNIELHVVRMYKICSK